MDALQEFIKRFGNFEMQTETIQDQALPEDRLKKMMASTQVDIDQRNALMNKGTFLDNNKDLMQNGLLGAATGFATAAGGGASKNDKLKASLEGAKQGAAASNPYAAMGKMVADTAIGLGEGLGGDVGKVYAESFFDPLTGLTDENLNTGQKIASLDPIMGMFIRPAAMKKAKEEEAKKKAESNMQADQLKSKEMKNDYNASQGLADMRNLQHLRNKKLS